MPPSQNHQPMPPNGSGSPDEFKNVSEHGECVWLFKDVKREIERIKFESDAKLNIRQLVNAILLAFVKEHREDLKNIRSG